MPFLDRIFAFLENATNSLVNPGDAANQALRVNVVAASATTGTQYTEGDTDSTITGTAIVFESNTGTSALSTVNATTPLPVDGGLVAHDAVDSGNPVKIGMRAIAHGANPTAVAAADRTDWLANRAGVPWVIGGHPNVQSYAQNFTGAQTDTALVTVSSGTIIVVTGFLITCHNTNTVNVSARLGFGTANVPAYGSAQIIGSHPGIAAGSGFGRGGGSGIIGVGADNEDLRVTLSVPTGGSADVNVSYYTIAS